MVGNKKVAIDARMIEMSGIGTYIQNIINSGVYDIAIGNADLIHKYAPQIDVVNYSEKLYSPKNHFMFPEKELKKLGVNVVHFPHYDIPYFYSGEYVVTIHDLIHLKFPEFLPNRLAKLYAYILCKRACKKAKVVFTVSENSKKDMVEMLGVNPDKVHITYNAVDERFKKKEKKEVEYLYDKYSIPRNKKIILYVGNLKPHKNLERLIEAFKGIRNKETILLLVGKAFKGVTIEREENKKELKDRIICTGMVGASELVDLYNIADLFVFPSLYEGFGIPPLEAMKCETIVACSNTSSLPEVVGDAAYMFDPYDERSIAEAINRALEDSIDNQARIVKGLERVKAFSWKDCIDNIRSYI